jgi:acylphosphatase
MDRETSQAQIRVRVKIEGRVQGVYFRASAVEQARRLGVTGWVRNCLDGSVEAVAEGTRAKIDELIAWCRQGPAGAQVNRVELEWQPCTNEFQGFRIKR